MSKELLLDPEFSSLVKPSNFIPVEVARGEILQQLKAEEQRDRARLELMIKQGLSQATEAFAEIRERRLYCSTHDKFDAYCRDTLKYFRRKIDI